MKSQKGGPRRHKVEDVCPEHLCDTLEKWVTLAGDDAFNFGEYNTIGKSQGTVLKDLLSLEKLLVMLFELNTQMEFKYVTLKEVCSKILRKHTSLKNTFPVSKYGSLAGDIANNIMTICTHARRFRCNTEAAKTNLEQSLKKCSPHQVQALMRIVSLWKEDESETAKLLPVVKSDGSVFSSLVSGDGAGSD